MFIQRKSKQNLQLEDLRKISTVFLPSVEVSRIMLKAIAKLSVDNADNKEDWHREALKKFNLHMLK